MNNLSLQTSFPRRLNRIGIIYVSVIALLINLFIPNIGTAALIFLVTASPSVLYQLFPSMIKNVLFQILAYLHLTVALYYSAMIITDIDPRVLDIFTIFAMLFYFSVVIPALFLSATLIWAIYEEQKKRDTNNSFYDNLQTVLIEGRIDNEKMSYLIV